MMRAAAPTVFRALSDPTRLRILRLLRDGELCVCDLMTILRVPQAKTSRHLGYLWRAGLVRVRQQGPWSYYSLAPAAGRFHRRLLDCLSAGAPHIPGIEADARRSARLRRGERCGPP